jgi:DNA-binding NarL/FixJ family response regulator
MIRVLIADDYPAVRALLYKLLENMPGIKPVGAAADGEKALQLVKRLAPDVALLDVDMPTINGFEVAAEIMKLELKTKVILVSAYQEVAIMEEAIKMGAAGYIAKCDLFSQLQGAIWAVHNDHTYFVLAR